MYLMVLEVFILGFVVFIMAPLLFVRTAATLRLWSELTFRLSAVVLEHSLVMSGPTPSPKSTHDQA